MCLRIFLGPETQYLVRELQAYQPYSFKVCCKFEGSSEWSPWSLPQVFVTNLKAFNWKLNDDFQLTNEAKIAKPIKDKPSLLISDGAQISAGCSVEFTVSHIYYEILHPNYPIGHKM